MSSSIETFNKYCSALPAKDLVAFLENDQDFSVFEGKTHLGADAGLKTPTTVDLKSYDELSDGGYDTIVCQKMPRSVVTSFSFPDLSHIKPQLAFRNIEGPIDFLPDGMKVRGFNIKSGSTPAVSSTLGSLMFVTTDAPLIFGAHIYIERAKDFGMFPDEMLSDIKDEVFKVRLDQSITHFGTFAWAQNTHFYFDNRSDVPTGADQLPVTAPFCQNYGKGTNAYIVGNDRRPGKDMEVLSKSKLCYF